MTATHLDNITISITLASAAAQVAGFGKVMHMVDEAQGTGNSLNGDRFREYQSVTAAQADQTAGYLTAEAVGAVTQAFAQRPQPSSIAIGRVDTGGGETYATALPLIIAATNDFYGITADTRTDSAQVALAAVVEGIRKLYVLQSADAGWRTAGVPAGYSAIAAYERTAVLYHDTSTAWMDVGWLANRLAFNPDTDSVPWHAPVLSPTVYASAPSDTEKGHLDDNRANNGLEYGGFAFYVDAGVNMAGRPLDQILTADWFETRLEENVASFVASESAAGRKVVVSSSGQSSILAILTSLLQQGVGAGHFTDGDNTEALAVDITTTDLSLQRMRFTARAQNATAGRLFEFSINFGLDPLT